MAQDERLSTGATQSPHYLLMAAPFPPPITGQTISSEALAVRLEAEVPLLRLNIVRGDGPKSMRSYVVRTFRVARAAVALVSGRRRSTVAYISVDANRGMVITILLAACARIGARRLLLHHHSYDHISTHKNLMALLSRVAGRATLHIVICDAMGEELKRRYSSVAETFSLSNIFLVPPAPPEVTDVRVKSPHVILGYLSKITREKGAYLALDTLKMLQESGVSAELRIGGAFETPQDEVEFNDKVAELRLEKHVNFLGFLDTNRKLKFFQSIDYFLFPSTYRNETQGIVNLESLSCNVPVIAFSQCCIPDDIGKDGGCVVSAHDDYARFASRYIATDFIGEEKKSNPVERFRLLRELSDNQMSNLIEKLFPR